MYKLYGFDLAVNHFKRVPIRPRHLSAYRSHVNASPSDRLWERKKRTAGSLSGVPFLASSSGFSITARFQCVIVGMISVVSDLIFNTCNLRLLLRKLINR